MFGTGLVTAAELRRRILERLGAEPEWTEGDHDSVEMRWTSHHYLDVVGPFRKWDDETELIRYMKRLDIYWDEDEGRAILEEQR